MNTLLFIFVENVMLAAEYRGNDQVRHVVGYTFWGDMMNVIWPKYVQGLGTLYYSRKLRFDDMFADQYRQIFDLDKEKEFKILEVGCGPGALAGALHRWYPRAVITALDRDSEFIRFAEEHEPGITFIEGDAKVNENDNTLGKYSVYRYPMSEAQLPAAMEQYGFRFVSTGYATVDLTPDDQKFPAYMAYEPDIVTAQEISEMKRRINIKYDNRLHDYDCGKKY